MNNTSADFPRANFGRRFAAIIYDLLVAVAIGMCAALVYMIVILIAFSNELINNGPYEHFMDFFQQSVLYKTILQLWVSAWIIAFFVWFWRNGGQTIGMRAWRLRLFSTNEQPFGYKRALLRLICSLGGLGTLLVLFDWKSKQSLQDRLCQTEILVLSKDANHHAAWKELQE